MSKSRFYRPPAVIREVAGVTRTPFNRQSGRGEGWDPRDRLFGSADALVATGLVTHDMFPGAPGMPSVTVTFQAEGTPWGHYSRQPWRMVIRRHWTGAFVIELTVTMDEQQRRETRAHLCEAARQCRTEMAFADANEADRQVLQAETAAAMLMQRLGVRL